MSIVLVEAPDLHHWPAVYLMQVEK
jgi:hypothetical protein